MSRDSAASYRRSTIVFSLIQDDSLMRICECRYYPRFVFTTFTYATADTETDTRTRQHTAPRRRSPDTPVQPADPSPNPRIRRASYATRFTLVSRWSVSPGKRHHSSLRTISSSAPSMHSGSSAASCSTYTLRMRLYHCLPLLPGEIASNELIWASSSFNVVVHKVLLVDLAVDSQCFQRRPKLLGHGPMVVRHEVLERIHVLELEDELVVPLTLADESAGAGTAFNLCRAIDCARMSSKRRPSETAMWI